MNKKIVDVILYVPTLLFCINCNRNYYDTKFNIYNNSNIKYDSIIINDTNGNIIKDFYLDIGKEKTILLKYNSDKNKGYIEGYFIIELYQNQKKIKVDSFGYWGLGSFFSCYDITITNDSILTKHSKNDFL